MGSYIKHWFALRSHTQTDPLKIYRAAKIDPSRLLLKQSKTIVKTVTAPNALEFPELKTQIETSTQLSDTTLYPPVVGLPVLLLD